MREATLTAVRFPDPLVLQQAGRGTARARQLSLVVDSRVDPIAKGEPTLGWEGDARLALYVDLASTEWVLIRYEHDGVYRIVCRWSAQTHRTGDIVGVVVLWLIAHDKRRGFDPEVDIATAEARVEMEQQRRQAEIAEDTADRLGHALRKDGVW